MFICERGQLYSIFVSTVHILQLTTYNYFCAIYDLLYSVSFQLPIDWPALKLMFMKLTSHAWWPRISYSVQMNLIFLQSADASDFLKCSDEPDQVTVFRWLWPFDSVQITFLFLQCAEWPWYFNSVQTTWRFEIDSVQ